MSEQNAETIRNGMESFNRRDVAALAAISTADAEAHLAELALEGGGSSFRGARQIWLGYYAAIDGIWEQWQIDEIEIFDADTDCIVAACLDPWEAFEAAGWSDQR